MSKLGSNFRSQGEGFTQPRTPPNSQPESLTEGSKNNTTYNRRFGDQNRGGARNLSYQELMDRHSKERCFKCGQLYSPTHQCPDKHLRLLIWDGEDSNTEVPLVAEDQQDGGAREDGC